MWSSFLLNDPLTTPTKSLRETFSTFTTILKLFCILINPLLLVYPWEIYISGIYIYIKYLGIYIHTHIHTWMISGKTWATALTLMKRKLQLWLLHLFCTATSFHLISCQSRNTHESSPEHTYPRTKETNSSAHSDQAPGSDCMYSITVHPQQNLASHT